jgi:tetratricopeptide (TPR) repeat protein
MLLTMMLLWVLGAAPPAPPPAQAPPTASRATPRQPAEVYLQFLLGRKLEGEGDIEGAVAAHRRAADLDPESAEIRAELSALYARQDRGREALQWAEAALAIDAGSEEAHRVLGLIHAALSDRPQMARQMGLPEDTAEAFAALASRHLEQAGSDTRVDASLHFALGRAYMAQRAYEKAIPVLRTVLQEEPGASEAALLLAEALNGIGSLVEARRTLEMVLADEPGSLRARLQLAEIDEREERWAAAAEQYARALEASPGSAQITRRRAIALLRAGDAGTARDLLEPVVARYRADPQRARSLELFLTPLGFAYQDLKQYDRAIQVFEEIRALGPDDDAILLPLAAAYERAGRYADAERTFRDLLAKDPLNAPALNYLGYMLAERGRSLEEAVELIQRALAGEPGNASYLDSLGWAYFKLGRLDLAEPPLQQAAKALVTTSLVQDHLGDLLFKLKRLDQAVAAWERALAGDGESIDRGAIEAKIRKARDKSRR